MIVYVLFLHSVLLIHIFFKIFKYLFAKKNHCAIYCFCTATKDIDSSLSNYMKCQFSFYGISRCFRLFHSYEQI